MAKTKIDMSRLEGIAAGIDTGLLYPRHFTNVEMMNRNHRNLIGLSKALINCYLAPSLSLWFGNGGAATNADHMVGELVGQFTVKDRPGMPAVLLGSSLGALTAVANDTSYDRVWEREIEAFAGVSSLAVGASTSGNSLNIVLGLEKAKEFGLTTGYLCGLKKGKYHDRLMRAADYTLVAPYEETPRVQEWHLIALHCLAETVEKYLWPEATK